MQEVFNSVYFSMIVNSLNVNRRVNKLSSIHIVKNYKVYVVYLELHVSIWLTLTAEQYAVKEKVSCKEALYSRLPFLSNFIICKNALIA